MGRKLNGGKSLRTKGNVQMHRCACDGMCAWIRVEMHVHARISMCLLTCELESVYVCVCSHRFTVKMRCPCVYECVSPCLQVRSSCTRDSEWVETKGCGHKACLEDSDGPGGTPSWRSSVLGEATHRPPLGSTREPSPTARESQTS